MTDTQQAVLSALRIRQAKTVAQMQLLGLEVVLDTSLPPRGEQLRVGQDVWDEMQALLPVVEDEIDGAEPVPAGLEPGD